MSSVSVVARLVDGSAQDWAFGEEFLERLAALEREGLKGRGLIDSLLGDDWGPPPLSIRITWTRQDGALIDRQIVYE
jgi:hypothetical protein